MKTAGGGTVAMFDSSRWYDMVVHVLHEVDEPAAMRR
jgi:hypothetical protein